MSATYENVVFLPAEAQFVANTIRAYSQNKAPGIGTDQGDVNPINSPEYNACLSILGKVNAQIANPTTAPPINFTQEEASLMQYLYNRYLQMHGKPSGDLDWTYWVHFDTNTQQLVINVLRKVGGIVPNLPSYTYPQGYNSFPKL